jgi:hypothetical protein
MYVDMLQMHPYPQKVWTLIFFPDGGSIFDIERIGRHHLVVLALV